MYLSRMTDPSPPSLSHYAQHHPLTGGTFVLCKCMLYKVLNQTEYGLARVSRGFSTNFIT